MALNAALPPAGQGYAGWHGDRATHRDKEPLAIDQHEPGVPLATMIEVPKDPRRPIPGHGVHNPGARPLTSSRLGSGNSASSLRQSASVPVRSQATPPSTTRMARHSPRSKIHNASL